MIHNQIPSRQKFKISPAESINYLMLRYVKRSNYIVDSLSDTQLS